MGQSGSSSHRGGASTEAGLQDGSGGKYTPSITNANANSGSNNNSSSAGSPPAWVTMEGPTYACDYLGYSTLSKPATGIASLQAPVKDLYLKFRKHAAAGTSPRKATFKITPGGLLVALQEGSNQVEMFFDIGSVNFIEAVRFAVLKGSEKKPKAIFLPLEESRGSVTEKVAFSLEKQFHFLVQSGHQPLLVCVLRRPKGVKALDCHVFAMDSPENALYVVSLVQQLLSPGGAGKDFPGGPQPGGDANFNRGGTRGDFIRTEFGEYNVYRGQAGQQNFELKDEHFRGGGLGGGGGGYPGQLDPGLGPRGGGPPNPRETYPAENAERPRFGWSYDKGQGGEEINKRVSGQFGKDGRPISGEPRPSGGRSSPPMGRPPQGQYPDDGRPGNQYYGDGRPGNQYPGDRRSGDGYVGVEGPGFRGGGGGPVYDPKQSGYRRQDYERPEISHSRERSGDSADNRGSGLQRAGSDRPPGGRPFDEGGMGPRGGYQDSRDPRYAAVGAPRADLPPKVMEKPTSPVRNTGPPTFPVSGGGPMSPRRGPDSPPFSPTTPTGGPAYSMSNRESHEMGPTYSMSNRESQEEVPGKPVAKVPPHLKGVKVLPSDFLAVKLKPKQPKVDADDLQNTDYDNNKHVMAQYKQLQELEREKDYHGFSDRELEKPVQQRSYNENWNDDGRGGGPGGYDRRYIEQYSSGGGSGMGVGASPEDVQLRGHSQGQQRYDPPPTASSGGTRYSAPSYAAETDRPHLDEWRSAKSSYEMGHGPRQGQGQGYPRGPEGQGYPRGQMEGQGQGYQRGPGGEAPRGMNPPSSEANDETQMIRKKDAEIANMFSNFRLQGPDPYQQERNNFEDSLGYLP